jgi:Zn-dependent protease
MQEHERNELPPEVREELHRRMIEQQALPDINPHKPSFSTRLKRFGPIGVILLFLLGKLKLLAVAGKFLLPVLQLAKFSKVFLTSGTMLLSVWVYAGRWGWSFAVGFVLSIFVHELGHVAVARMKGIPVSAPIFIPGMGALIVQKQSPKTTWDQALIGLGGPIGGTIAGLFCLMLYGMTSNHLMLALAYTGFMINLFNLIPVAPLDGGWITGAVSPRIWLVGLLGLLCLAVAGIVRNPFIWVIMLLSLPRLWHGLKTGQSGYGGMTEATKDQRIRMGITYVSLCAFLAWLMASTHFTI